MPKSKWNMMRRLKQMDSDRYESHLNKFIVKEPIVQDPSVYHELKKDMRNSSHLVVAY